MKITPYMRKAQYHETDQMGIIHHANYIRWFEEISWSRWVTDTKNPRQMALTSP